MSTEKEVQLGNGPEVSRVEKEVRLGNGPAVSGIEKEVRPGHDPELLSSEGMGSDTSHDPIDRAAESRLLRKCDIHVIPILFVIYLISFLDRINIGNARIEGLERDLRMRGTNYNVALLIFFG